MGQEGEEMGRSEGQGEGTCRKVQAHAALVVGRREHSPESNIVDIIPDGSRGFPEGLLNVLHKHLEGTGSVVSWTI